MIELTDDEIIELMDCVNNRIDDLTDCARYGDGEAIESEVERLNTLRDKLGKHWEVSDGLE